MSKIIKEFKKTDDEPGFIQWKIETINGLHYSIHHERSIFRIIFTDGVPQIIHNEVIQETSLKMPENFVKQKLKFNGFTFQTEKTYDVDYENFKDNNTAEAFQHWWNEEGSLFTPEENEDQEEFMKRICGIAWNNGAFVQNK